MCESQAPVLILLALTLLSSIRSSLTLESKSLIGNVDHHETSSRHIRERRFNVFDDVYLSVPVGGNVTDKLFSLEIGSAEKSLNEGRGKQKKNNLLQKLLPMFIIPFIIQSTIIPFFLGFLKFMLFKSLVVGKTALSLVIFNAFRNHNSFKDKKEEIIADVHYGYHGNKEEYGAWVN